MARRQHFGPCDIYVVEREGGGGHLVVLFATAQEGREDRESAPGPWKSQHRRPRGAHLPARHRSDMRVLRLPVRRRRAGDHQTASPAKSADDPADRTHDCGCQQVCACIDQSEHPEAVENEGNREDRFI